MGKAKSKLTYITEPPNGSAITYRGQGEEQPKTGEWVLALYCLLPVPSYCFWVENQCQGLRTGVREAVSPIHMLSLLYARPQVSVVAEGGRHRNSRSALSWEGGAADSAERPACRGA